MPGGGGPGGDVHETVVLDVVEDGGAGDHVDRDQHDHTHLIVTITHYRYPDVDVGLRLTCVNKKVKNRRKRFLTFSTQDTFSDSL